MDILAARKKAAELAKARKEGRAAETEIAAVPQPQAPEPVPAAPQDDALPETEAGEARQNEAEAAELFGEFPPIPDTTFVPDAPAPALDERPVEEPAASAQTDASPQADATAGPAPQADEAAGQPAQEELLEMLAFQLGTEEYVVPVGLVREVVRPREITPVPHLPGHVLGVCSLRGEVLPVIDLNRRLGLEEPVRDEKARIVVVGVGQDERMGLFVDRVRGVVRFPPSAIRPAPDTVDEGAEFLEGIARKDERLYILLNMDKAVAA